MNRQSALFQVGVLTLGALLARWAPLDAVDVSRKDGTRSDLELICLAEQPAIVQGQSATLKAWVGTFEGRPITARINLRWEVDAGRIEAQRAATRWDLSAVKVEPAAARKVTATVKADAPGWNGARCNVEVFIGKKEVLVNDRGTVPGANVVSARTYLLPGEDEAPGYGLYSYLLFSAPPKDAEEMARYLKTLEACLVVLQDVDEYLRRHVRPRDLNATYIPLKEAPRTGKSNAESAANLLTAYDYASAQILLSRVRRGHQKGPYLISVLQPLSSSDAPVYLWEDLTGVVPEQAWDWIRYFTYLAAQQRSWSDNSLKQFGLKLRNLIAVGGKVTPDFVKGLEEAIQFNPKA